MAAGRSLATEVCVIGGGPAGAVIAWKLARLGHPIVVVEAATFPRPHVGEALSPGIWPQLDLLEIAGAVRAAGFRPTAAARVRWSAGSGGGGEVVHHGDPPGLMVDRGSFDRLLLEHAREAGAHLLQPGLALAPCRADGGWRVPVRMADGEIEVRCRFLVDASGRASRLPGRREPAGPRTLTLHGVWARRQRWSDETHVEAGPDEWLWAAQRPDGTLSAMVFLDAERYRSERVGGTSRDALYRRLVAHSALHAETSAAELTGPAGVCDATRWHAREAVGDGFLKIGEAAFTLDPLSSTGVQKALQTAWTGAIVVHTILARPTAAEAARSFYADSHGATVERHAAWAARFYSEARQYADRPFWRQRSAPEGHRLDSDDPAAPSTPPAPDTVLRLSAASSLVETPCAAGDFIETRRALAHPLLPRPVAFLDGIEIAPLLATVAAGATFGELTAAWAQRLPGTHPQRASALAAWLFGRGVLEAS